MRAPATAWVLLRGLTRETRHWGRFGDELSAALGGAKVVALDLPGNGRLHAQRSPRRVEAYAQACREELRRRGLPPPYRVLAMSLGGMVAVAWADRHPDELRSGVLVNTSLRPYGAFHQRLRPGSWPGLLRLALTDASPRTREAVVLRLTSHRAEGREEVLREWTAWRNECPVSRANALRQLLAAARFHAPAAPPVPPLLLLASTRDGLVDVRCSRRLAQAWRLPLVEHPQAGHDLPLDDPAWVVGQVRRWVDATN